MEEEYWDEEQYYRALDLQWEEAYEALALYPHVDKITFSEKEIKELPF